MTILTRIFVVVALLLLAACESKEPIYQEQGYVFGTLVEVSVYGETEARAKQAVSEVLHEFQRLHDMLHAWQPSELSELNAAFANGESAAVSAELVAILRDRKSEMPKYEEAVKTGDPEKMLAAIQAQAAIERRALATVAAVQDGG